MKTKTTKTVDQDDLLDIEKVATEMAASAVATAETKPAKVSKKKTAPVESDTDTLVSDSSIETVAEGLADKVIIVADETVAADAEATTAAVENKPATETQKTDSNQILFFQAWLFRKKCFRP